MLKIETTVLYQYDQICRYMIQFLNFEIHLASVLLKELSL